MTVWLNGRLLPTDAAWIDPADRGFTLGDGLFETIRVTGGRARHLDRHLARLQASAAVLDLPVPYRDDALANAVAALIAARGVAEGVARLTLTRGIGARGVLPPADPQPTVLITLTPAGPPAGPVEAVIAQGTRRNEHSPLSRLKTLNYLDAILARREAARRGAGEALLLNTAGRLAEASVATLFIVRDGRLADPVRVGGGAARHPSRPDPGASRGGGAPHHPGRAFGRRGGLSVQQPWPSPASGRRRPPHRDRVARPRDHRAGERS
ncbi:branched-chain amino acid aminotransferase [Azospirillum canadense]|nr:branched-chain amino acid aminotransferase [Azospirillum canadense]